MIIKRRGMEVGVIKVGCGVEVVCCGVRVAVECFVGVGAGRLGVAVVVGVLCFEVCVCVLGARA